MTRNFKTRALALAMGLAPVAIALPAPVAAQVAKPAETLNLSQGTGQLVRLPIPMSDVFIANDRVADVQVRSPTQLYVFGQTAGETTLYATDKSGKTIYAANVRVGKNIGSIDEMLRMAMPDANITATPMNNLLLLTGTVASPDDLAEAEELVKAYVGGDMKIVSRIKTATPLQVTLKVRFAEVSRSALKSFGVNLSALGSSTGGNSGGFTRGTPLDDAGNFVRGSASTFGLATKLLGLDIGATLDLAQSDGLATTLAEPVLSTLSGETASFLAGGEFPIPASGELGSTSVSFKSYGVSLAFSPVVLADGRISLRVRPEVSQLSSAGSVKINNFEIPALITRRAETTVELGSGQSYMIAGLLQNTGNNDISKTPVLGDLPVLGALFRSTSFRKSQTELVIIVTPYLTRPVSGRLPLPTDGYRQPSDAQIWGQGMQWQNYPQGAGTASRAGGRPAAPATTAQALPAPGFGK